MNNHEIRSFTIEQKDTRHVAGYAIVFNSLSVDLGGFREIISSDAITQELIDNSDVIFNYNHDNNMMLGRSRNGQGTLSLRKDEHGLYFECELPNSPMGENVLESIKRGDLSQCSFAFTINPEDEGAETWERRDDGIYRTINRIAGLYDVSAVCTPAYEDTEISTRAKNILEEMNKEDIELREDEKSEDIKDEELQDKEEQKSEDEKPEDLEQKSSEEDEDKEDTNSDDEQSDDEQSEDEQSDEKPEDKEKEEQKSYKNKSHNIMEKRFSLLKSIRDIANGNKLDDASQAVVNAGAEEMRKAGQSFNGQIQLPVAELREGDPVHYTVEADGEHVVVTDYLNILEPLKSKNVLVNAGANYLTGLVGNVQIPTMTAENVYWEGEITSASNGAGSFDHINMAPRRLSAYVDISKQFLVQDSLGAENLIRKQLVEAINDKLEATILSDAAASGNVPAGIFNGVTATEIASYADVCDFEAELDNANFIGDFKYVINPKAKAALRSMIKGTNATGMVMENNAIDGTPTEMTTHMDTDTLAYGDWSQLYIGQWGAIDLTVDPYTKAADGQVRLVINAFFDYKVVRDGAIVLGQIKRD